MVTNDALFTNVNNKDKTTMTDEIIGDSKIVQVSVYIVCLKIHFAKKSREIWTSKAGIWKFKLLC